MSYNTKNYAAHGGSEWVVGGKLTFLPGAQVEGLDDLLDISIEPDPLEAATADAIGGVMLAANQADSTASTVAGLKDDLNALLAKLKAAGVMAADEPGE
jgi:hypothetical protein